MRVTLVTSQLGGSYIHGTERYVASLGAELSRQGHDVIYLAGDPKREKYQGEIGTVVDPDLPLYAYPTRGPAAIHGYSEIRVAKWLQAQRPDIVHVASLAHIGVGALLAAKSLGVATVATVMDFWWVCPRGTLLRRGDSECSGTPAWKECLSCTLSDHVRPSRRPLAPLVRHISPLAAGLLGASVLARGGEVSDARRWMRRRPRLTEIFREIDQIIFPSPATKAKMLPQLGHNRWTEIPYGLDDAFFTASKQCSEISERNQRFSPDSLVYGFAGSLQSHKGPHLLLEAVRQLGWKNTRIRIAGTVDDPAYWSELLGLAKGLSVEFVGPLAQSEMTDFYSSLDVLILSSRWPENLPFVLLEAQAAGLAVIGSDVLGISHRIPNQKQLFKAGSASSLARTMGAIIPDSLRRKTPSVSRLKEMTSATETVYRNAIETNARGKRFSAPCDL